MGPMLSVNDKRSLKILESTTKNVGNRYEFGLMWASDVKLPDNRKAALRRLLF
jgi:hypothetical protein